MPTFPRRVCSVLSLQSSTSDPNLTNNSAHVDMILATTGGSAAGGGGCFIATAAYGSYLDPHVQVLRAFRDRQLLTNGLGRAFVRIYYRYSPAAAAWIARSRLSRGVVRLILAPLIFGIEYPAGLLSVALICALALALGRRAKRTHCPARRLPWTVASAQRPDSIS